MSTFSMVWTAKIGFPTSYLRHGRVAGRSFDDEWKGLSKNVGGLVTLNLDSFGCQAELELRQSKQFSR